MLLGEFLGAFLFIGQFYAIEQLCIDVGVPVKVDGGYRGLSDSSYIVRRKSQKALEVLMFEDDSGLTFRYLKILAAKELDVEKRIRLAQITNNYYKVGGDVWPYFCDMENQTFHQRYYSGLTNFWMNKVLRKDGWEGAYMNNHWREATKLLVEQALDNGVPRKQLEFFVQRLKINEELSNHYTSITDVDD